MKLQKICRGGARSSLFYVKIRVSPIEALTTLNKPEHIETWIRCFTALAKVKKLKNEKASGGKNEITDLLRAAQTVKLRRIYWKWPKRTRNSWQTREFETLKKALTKRDGTLWTKEKKANHRCEWTWRISNHITRRSPSNIYIYQPLRQDMTQG